MSRCCGAAFGQTRGSILLGGLSEYENCGRTVSGRQMELTPFLFA